MDRSNRTGARRGWRQLAGSTELPPWWKVGQIVLGVGFCVSLSVVLLASLGESSTTDAQPGADVRSAAAPATTPVGSRFVDEPSPSPGSDNGVREGSPSSLAPNPPSSTAAEDRPPPPGPVDSGTPRPEPVGDQVAVYSQDGTRTAIAATALTAVEDWLWVVAPDSQLRSVVLLYSADDLLVFEALYDPDGPGPREVASSEITVVNRAGTWTVV